MTQPWLVVIDPQTLFASPDASPWGSPMFDDALPHVLDLTRAFGPVRTVVTRFVADATLGGSWADYYEQWPFALVPDADPLYALVPPLADAAHVVTEPTFGKWTRALRAVVGEQPHLVIAGVATDCCVLSTALAAADAGAAVTIATDACAGSNAENHRRALDVMAGFAPQITLTTTARLLDARSRD